MKERLKLVQSWNKISNLLIELRDTWEEHRERWALVPKTEIEMLPPEYQKFLARNFNRSPFNIMLPRMVDYWRTLGGVDALRVGPSPEEMMKELKKEKKETK